MNKKSKLILLPALGALLFSMNSFADVSSSLERYFDQKISNFYEDLAQIDATSAPAAPSMVLSDFNVQVAAPVTIGIKSVLHLTIMPEVDFIVTPPVSQ